MKKKLPIFSTPEGRAKYMAAYEAMFDLWKVAHDCIDVKTSYGSTHINVSGPGDAYPLVLLLSFRFHNETHIVSGGIQDPSPRKIFFTGGGSKRDGY